MVKQYFSNIHRNPQKLTAVLVVLLVAGVGTYLIVGSHAASPYASISADRGNTACGASVVSDPTASDGNKVVFGNCTSTASQTFYISYSSGSDSNSGTSESSPWKLAPGMQGFCPGNTGGCASYSHKAGTHFIFEGGVTWPNTVFPLEIQNSGATNNKDYYGVHTSWYTGSGFIRPIFNANSAAISGSFNGFINLNENNYITLDNLNMTGFYWNNAPGYGTCAYIQAQNTEYVTISNMYMHGWTHGSSAVDDCDLVVGTPNGNNNLGDVISNSVFDGSDTTNGGDAMQAAFAWSNFENNVCNQVPDCYLGSGGAGNTVVVSSNLIENCTSSFSGNHENGIETTNAGGNYYISNNVINYAQNATNDDPTCVSLFTGDDAGVNENDYIWNNVFYNLGGNDLDLDPANPGNVVSYWNNTISELPAYDSDLCIRFGDHGPLNGEVINVYNNHCISNASEIYDSTPGDGLGTATVNSGNNLLQSLSAATSDGYSSSSQYAFEPTSSSGATVGTGTDLSSNCSGSNSGLCSSTGYACTWDIANNTVSCPADSTLQRPSNSWDIGAYQYSASQ